MQITSTTIHLDRVKLFAHHGALSQERATGAYFYIDLHATCDFRAALTSDALPDTVNYAALYDVVRQEMAIPSSLLEHVAGRILTRLFHDFPAICSVRLSLTKENPPMGADCRGAGIEVEATR